MVSSGRPKPEHAHGPQPPRYIAVRSAREGNSPGYPSRPRSASREDPPALERAHRIPESDSNAAPRSGRARQKAVALLFPALPARDIDEAPLRSPPPRERDDRTLGVSRPARGRAGDDEFGSARCLVDLGVFASRKWRSTWYSRMNPYPRAPGRRRGDAHAFPPRTAWPWPPARERRPVSCASAYSVSCRAASMRSPCRQHPLDICGGDGDPEARALLRVSSAPRRRPPRCRRPERQFDPPAVEGLHGDLEPCPSSPSRWSRHPAPLEQELGRIGRADAQLVLV